MTQDMSNKIMTRLVLDEITARRQRDYGSCLTRLRLVVLMLLMMVVGVNGVKADDYEGTWYIKSYNSYSSEFNPEYYFVPTINCFYNDDEDKPHLTTFKTGGDKNSIWRFEKVTEGSNIYYRIIHNATGKYLVVNDAVPELAAASQKQAHRKRVHLETLTTPGEESLFSLVEPGDITGVIGIRHKSRGSSTTGDGTNHYFVNPQSGNYNIYCANNGREITRFQGIIGFYGMNVPSSGTDGTDSRWKLYDANNTCANPVIKYTDDSTIEISYPIASDTGWTIYYTTDGSDPASGTAITATTSISATGVTKVRAIAKKASWEDSDESFLIASSVTQLVQSKECEAFYMVPPIVDGDLASATTTNIPHAKMGWKFVPAGLYCGIQYYNIVNAETNEWLYCNVGGNAGSALIMKSSSEIISDTNNETIDRAKFRLMRQSDGSYKLIAKWWAAENTATSNYYITKNGGNDNASTISTSTGTDSKALWNVIAAPASPKTQFDASFATTTESKYYIIKSASDDTYHIIPPTTTGGLATANTTGDNPDWIFSPVDDTDTWTQYYQIINGVTGEYLFYNESVSDASKRFLTSTTVDSENADRYKFVVVKSANTTYTNPYNIIPKALKNKAKQENNSIKRNNTTALIWGNSRASAASLWLLDQDASFVSPATITFSAEDMKVYMNSSTINASKEIRYNVSYNDDADPDDPTSLSTQYVASDGRSVSYGPIYHFKAKTFVGGNSSTSTTKDIDLRLVDPTIDVDYDLLEATISTTQYSYTLGTGVQLYYTTDGSDPYTDADHHGTLISNGTSTINLTYGAVNTIKVRAVSIADDTTYKTEIKTEVADLSSGASNYRGIYYIQNNKSQAYYMCPNDNSDEPKVKTTTGQDEDAVWELKKSGDYYYIIHHSDGKYMVADPATDKNTVTLKLYSSLTSAELDNALFDVTEDTSSPSEGDIHNKIFLIRPKNVSSTATNPYLDASGGNNGKNTIGLYKLSDGVKWKLAKVPAKPVITAEGIDVTISNPLGETYYAYTLDGLEPIPSKSDGTLYSEPFTLEYGPTYKVKAIRYYTNKKDDEMTSDMSETVTVHEDLEVPIISVSGTKVTFYNSQSQLHPDKVSFKYTISESSDGAPADPDEPTIGTGSGYISETGITLENGKHYKIKVIAYNPNLTTYFTSSVFREINLSTAETISSLSGITSSTGNYKLGENFTEGSSRASEGGYEIGSQDLPFRGTIEGYIDESTGEIKPITLSAPLFDYVKDATIKNVVVKCGSDGISGSGNVGAIAGNALGDSRIYNCGVLEGSVSGDDNVGSIVGKIEDFARVINCYSFANITGGSVRAGIVGYNSYASKSNDLRTMVMNCIFYGDISTGGTIYPVYGGLTIDNLQNNNGLNNYNYYRYESDFSKNKLIGNNNYNCALAVEENYLTRFEFYRQLLNSNRKLAAWYVTGNVLSEDEVTALMGKWVMNKCDKDPSNTETRYNYPILKSHGKYPSIINYDAEHATAQTERNKGGLLGDLIVNISVGSNTAAAIKSDCSQITLKRTDKDFDNYNLNYNKVQLPYFNDVGTGNYTGNKVVTGWKITSMTGGTQGSFTASDSWGGYNFADRSTYAKDIYSSDNIRVFSQGAYFDVPDDVTAINIEPYWGTAAYVSDPNLDKVYDGSYTESTAADVTGEQYQDGQSYDINGSSQVVYNSISSAVGQLSGSTVYDNAVVLVGNVHQREVPSSGTTPFTIMSADLDNDNEPDYSLIYTHSGRDNGAVSSIRFDFLNVPGMAMVQKPNGSKALRNVNIFKPKGWFEVTNTCLIHFVQFEYDNGGKSTAPLILLGGAYDQFVSTQKSSLNDKHTSYIHVGSNAWFNQFANGTHGDGSNFTPHIPISVTGGDYGNFYLSGIYNPNASVTADDAECYISGGRFQELAGAGQEQIDGKVTWLIDRADITEFYGGGINEEKPITGNITVTIKNSNVTRYCGGPKFGKDDEKKVMVTTEATNCDFVNFYGAGYGGISYNRVKTTDSQSINWTNASNAYTDNRGKYLDKITDSGNKSVDAKGIATDFDNEYFVGSNGNVWGRIYVKFASLSLAEVNEVSSTLKNCRITENFFGGGNRGKVHGNIASTLEDCHVTGSVFGAGFSADVPKIAVRDGGFTTNPSFNSNAGVFDLGVKSGTHDYEWTEGTLTDDTSAITTDYKIHTNKDLGALGQVEGDAEVTLQTTSGNETTVGASVYGGGDQSTVGGNAILTLKGNTTVNGDVFGGGNEGEVQGSTTVNIK